jgi:hypothetical protein
VALEFLTCAEHVRGIDNQVDVDKSPRDVVRRRLHEIGHTAAVHQEGLKGRSVSESDRVEKVLKCTATLHITHTHLARGRDFNCAIKLATDMVVLDQAAGLLDGLVLVIDLQSTDASASTALCHSLGHSWAFYVPQQ